MDTGLAGCLRAAIFFAAKKLPPFDGSTQNGLHLLTTGKGSTRRSVKGIFPRACSAAKQHRRDCDARTTSNSTTTKFALKGCRGLRARDVCKANALRNARKKIRKSIPQRVGHG